MEPFHGNKKVKPERYVFQLMTKDWKYICVSHPNEEFTHLAEFCWKHSLLIDDSLEFGRFNKAGAIYEYKAQGSRIVIDVYLK